MSAIKKRIPFVILAGVVFAFIWWLCAATNIPFDADNPLEGAHGICDITDWDGPAAVYDCTDTQRGQAIAAAHARFNVAASLISGSIALIVTMIFWGENESQNSRIRAAQSMPIKHTRDWRRLGQNQNPHLN